MQYRCARCRHVIKWWRQRFDKREGGEDRQSHVAATFTTLAHVWRHIFIRPGTCCSQNVDCFIRSAPEGQQDELRSDWTQTKFQRRQTRVLWSIKCISAAAHEVRASFCCHGGCSVSSSLCVGPNYSSDWKSQWIYAPWYQFRCLCQF